MNNIMFGKCAIILVLIMIFLPLCLAVYHNLKLKTERKNIIPNGNMVYVDGRKMHVYIEGKQSSQLKLVFLSGSATVAPVYDFKSVYGKLSDQYKIIVVEKTGYGYSDEADVARDIQAIVSEERKALHAVGEKGPYILVPHSMGGLEAIYWAQHYPEEVKGIIGIDMAIPEAYEKMNINASLRMMKLLKGICFLGIQRIPFVYPLNTGELNDEEKKQQKLMLYSYNMNKNFQSESENVRENAEKVKKGGSIQTPLLMFISNGKEIGDFWIPCQQKFAKQNHGIIIPFECGHFIHHYKSEAMAQKIKEFVINLTHI